MNLLPMILDIEHGPSKRRYLYYTRRVRERQKDYEDRIEGWKNGSCKLLDETLRDPYY
jgi:hypothetical protein